MHSGDPLGPIPAPVSHSTANYKMQEHVNVRMEKERGVFLMLEQGGKHSSNKLKEVREHHFSSGAVLWGSY